VSLRNKMLIFAIRLSVTPNNVFHAVALSVAAVVSEPATTATHTSADTTIAATAAVPCHPVTTATG
jgi:hypothetical protein